MSARSSSLALVAVTMSTMLTTLSADVARAAPGARIEVALDEGDPRGVVSLESSVGSTRRGDAFDVGVRFELDEGWHVYFRNPGEAALGTELTYRAEGAQVGETAWPVPTRLLDPSGTIATFAYEHEVLFVAPVTVAPDAGSTVTVTVVADFLICRVECIPGRVTLTRAIPVTDATVPAIDEVVARFTATRAALPTSPDAASARVSFVLEPRALAPSSRARGRLLVRCDAPSCAPFRLDGVRPESIVFPDRVDGVRVRATGLRAVSPQEAELTLELEASPDDPRADQQLSGIVALPTERGRLALEFRADLPRARATSAPSLAGTTSATGSTRSTGTPTAPMPLGLLLVFAFLGGLVLNVMPCVLPVLALKAFAIARDGQGPRAARARHAAAYAAGVVASFVALAIAVVSLRAAGTSVGWGMQLQEPRFVTALAAVVVAFALGLFGVYTIGVDATALAERVDRRSGLARAFGEGVLTVALATPCSAPFLGSAVGFALTQGDALVVTTFVVVGLGLATPFVVLSLVPGATRWVPRPGAFMHVVEQLLGFALLFTAGWLLWVVGTLAGVDGMARALAFTILAAFVTWAASGARSLGQAARWAVRTGLVALLGLGGFVLVRDLAVSSTTPSADTARSAWSDEAVRTHLAAGSPVFVDFTASWCITCKANERLVLASDAVRARFAEASVVTLVGDYTQRDPRIGAVLERHQKAGVPLYLVYSPARPDAPEVLPELLTEGIVLDAITRTEGGSR